ncbi:hypothetical protein DICSQDRAFT_79616 [Dichomitus squalens LYAD-421 SS1]|uniref:uncharacterized protein n=1 Tax=Dichomitus squalens (strain LYAD-421) TaxID=732165 RepID=UPI000441520F|nr:uncharacterized protein DICSQDRAFT_79616 [Dichomitus squalens LYAD-421 SS1]EJF65444.1 hypothetical protein DICSQDRAFT_79616 [Dichomitus squalens LYAD-421 SS1]
MVDLCPAPFRLILSTNMRLRLIRRVTASRIGGSVISGVHTYTTKLPVQVDLLERYRGLVALGRIKEDEEQIRVIMQLRRLHRELDGYAPPALQSRYLNQTHSVIPGSAQPSSGEPLTPWWAASDPLSDKSASARGLVRIRTHAEEIEALTTPKGLTITGPPGSGKSFLIDLWFSTLPTPYKTRKHYNELVLEIYRAVWEETRRRMAAIHPNPESPAAAEEPSRPWNKLMRERWRQLLKSGSLPVRWTRKSNMSFSLSRTPLEPSIAYVVAQRLILRHWLLVFDEIQLLDVSSATLLADVLSWFWRMGGIIVGSSNKVPDDLYKNGVQRERLEPFVEALKARCPVVSMRSDRDWRAVRGNEGKNTWYTFDQQREFEAEIAEVTGNDSQTGLEEASSAEIVVFGRGIRVPWSANGVCQFKFSQLCDESLGPADYITLAAKFHTFVITSIPVLKLSAKNQARRFISLIDAFYEARCRIICLAEASPAQLFFPDAPSSEGGKDLRSYEDVDVMMAEAVGETQDVYRPNVSSYDAPNMARESTPAKTLALDTLSIFSGKDEQFAFKRALSRLLEMTSESYAKDEQWTPLPPDSRKWETSDSVRPSQPSITTSPSSQPARAQFNAPSSPDLADFAEEAALSSPTPASPFPAERPPAPRLSADHIWGVREDWGKRAGDWGRGAALHGPPPAPSPPGPAHRDAFAEEPERSQGGGDKTSRRGQR